MERVHHPLSYDSHAARIYFHKNTNMFFFVMLCVLCSKRRWNRTFRYGWE